LCVTAAGEIVACHRISSEVDILYNFFHYGKVTDEIYINDEKLSKVIMLENAKQPECSDCFAKYHCAGICPINRLLFTKEQLPVYCNFTKTIIQKELENKLNQNKY
jgi:radical SAM protein with 4Fe4S-binding SPASM domain